jgi:hypothetical protein
MSYMKKENVVAVYTIEDDIGISNDRHAPMPCIVDEAASLEHDPEKWKPVFGKDHAPMRNLDLDPIQLNWIKI